MNSGFKDHFSGHARQYARYRPSYPAKLYDWLAEQAPARNCAWDVATGSGQAAVEIARRFRQVIATDGSQQQIDQAVPASNIEYRVETAEACTLADHSMELVTVAQAYHWFDHSSFVALLPRIATQNAVFAIWTYTLAQVSAEMDQVIRNFYAGPIDPYWPDERRLVEKGYSSLQFPWPEMTVPDFNLELQWSLADLLGYLGTWSAVQRYKSANLVDPVSLCEPELRRAWGEAVTRVVRWPMRVRAFRVNPE